MTQPSPTTIRLSKKEIENLERLAFRWGCLSNSGPTSGKPSWRKLVKMVATGELEITRRSA